MPPAETVRAPRRLFQDVAPVRALRASFPSGETRPSLGRSSQTIAHSSCSWSKSVSGTKEEVWNDGGSTTRTQADIPRAAPGRLEQSLRSTSSQVPFFILGGPGAGGGVLFPHRTTTPPLMQRSACGSCGLVLQSYPAWPVMKASPCRHGNHWHQVPPPRRPVTSRVHTGPSILDALTDASSLAIWHAGLDRALCVHVSCRCSDHNTATVGDRTRTRWLPAAKNDALHFGTRV